MKNVDNTKKDCPGCGSKMKRVPSGKVMKDDGAVYDEMIWVCADCGNEENAGTDIHNYKP